MLLLFFVVFGATLLLGVPVSFSLGLSGAAVLSVWEGSSPLVLAQKIVTSMSSFPLMAIPFFLLAGDLMSAGGIITKLIEFSNLIVGRFRGGLAHVNILSNMIFAGVSGSAVADTAGIGSILIPAMVEEGYDLDFSAAVTSAGGTIGPIIPPSIGMVIYAIIAGNMSIATLFATGFLPGILIGLGFMVVSYLISRKRNYPVHRVEVTMGSFFQTLAGASYALAMPVLVLGAILGGFCTVTEAAALAAVYALFIGLFVTRKLTLADVYRIVLRAGTITATVLLLIGVGNVAGWFFAVNQVPQRLASFMMSVAPGPGPFLVFTILILLVAGCLLDTSAALVLLVPILIPIASHYGFNPYHFGFVVVLDLMIGLITPPVGVVLFVCVGLHKDLTIENLVRALPPFYLVELVVLLLSAFVPEMVLVVPRLLGLL